MSFENQIQQWVSLDNQLKQINDKAREIREKRTKLTENITKYAENNNLYAKTINISDGYMIWVLCSKGCKFSWLT